MPGWGRFRKFLVGGAVFALASTAAVAAAERDPSRSLLIDDYRPSAPTASTLAGTTGNHKRAVLLCAFTGSPSPSTKPLSYFQTMFNDPDNGLLKYFEEASYGELNMTAQYFDWATMPGNYNDYVNNSDKIFEDCTDAHDAAVNFENFDAIDVIANDTIGNAYLGGRKCVPAGTVLPMMCWRMTMLHSADGNNSDERALWAHEMGHSLDLPHTTGTAGSHYWDPMGFPAGWCFLNNKQTANYGCLPTHYLAAHKDRKIVNMGFPYGKQPFGLGWIKADRRFIAEKGTSTKITLERLAEPRNNNNPLIARIPVDGKGFYYAVESRIRTGKFDSTDNLPGDAVIISKVDWTCGDPCDFYFPVLVIGKDKDGDYLTDPGSAMWKPGETFKGNGIKVDVISKEGDNGHNVRITVPD